MNIALVNYSSTNSWYHKGQDRLKQLMPKFGFNGTMYMFNDTKQFNSPEHKDNQYAFKIYAIKHALDKGHDIIWWMDSSIYPVKDISPILNIVKEKGYFFEECGYKIGQWTNDRTLEYFKINRDYAMEMSLFSAGFMILDFNKDIVKSFFNELKKSCDDGMFIGNWNNINNIESSDIRCLGHRHDMSCASIIANKLNMEFSKQGQYLTYIGEGYEKPSDTSIFHLYPVI